MVIAGVERKPFESIVPKEEVRLDLETKNCVNLEEPQQ